jgi:predicted O-linked N-acetylglucosamine transferase (SPINDLY family)
MLGSPLLDAERFTRNLEDGYSWMWDEARRKTLMIGNPTND